MACEVYLGAGILAKAELQIFLCIRQMGCDGDTNVDSHSPMALKVRLSSERQVISLGLGCILWRFGRVLLRLCSFLRSLLRVDRLFLFPSGVHESDAVRVEAHLHMALALPVRP